MNINQTTVIAVDLGGTWMRSSVVGKDGSIRGQLIRRPTGRQRLPEEIIKDLISLITETASPDNASKEVGIAGVALGVPTVIDTEDRLAASDNLPTLGGIALGKEIERRTGWPVRLFNDAACFTVGEWRWGIGKGMLSFCGITLGTGIGLGIIADGRLLKGSRGMAGEIWKSSLGTAQVEDFVSGAGLMRLFKARTGRSIAGEDIHVLAEKGDPAALAVFNEFGCWLGQTLAWIINCIDPDAIALGGSVVRSFSHFEQPMRETMARYCSHDVRTSVSASVLGEKASMIGAAELFNDSMNKISDS